MYFLWCLVAACPVQCITQGEERFVIDPDACIFVVLVQKFAQLKHLLRIMNNISILYKKEVIKCNFFFFDVYYIVNAMK